MSYRVEIAAAADEDVSARGSGAPEYGEFRRQSSDPRAVEFDVESGAEWDELLAQAEYVLRNGDGGLTEDEEGAPPGYETGERLAAVDEGDRERRIYRGRTIAMLRRYMRYSMETGRLPSILGREFFRAKVTSYTVVTFEDRVIFVHDMEKCLAKLDEFSQQLIARHILQEHDRWATAKLLGCNEKTVRRLMPIALDLLSEVLLDCGLLERRENVQPLVKDARGEEQPLDVKKSCQGGFQSQNSASACERGKNKF